MAAEDGFEITVSGQGGHGGMPAKAQDNVLAVSGGGALAS